MSRKALVLLVCCCDFRDGAERLIPSKSLRNAVIRAFPGLFRILRMCAPRRAAAVVRPREREKSADRRRRILISRLLIIRTSVPRRKSLFPAYFKGFPAVSPLIPPYPAFLKYPVSPQETLVGGHLDDTEKHLTQVEREEWSRPSSELYFYDGNDASQRSFTLDFEPRFCTVYALGMPPSVNDMSTPSVSLCYHAAAGQNGKATVGIALSGKTLTAYNDPDLSMAQTRRKLNAQGISYVCQLFR